jgi:hypothetical protein
MPAFVNSRANPTAVPELPSGASSETMVTHRPCHPMRQNPPSAAPTTTTGIASSAGAPASSAVDTIPSSDSATSPGRRRLPNARSLSQPHPRRPATPLRFASATMAKASVLPTPRSSSRYSAR